MRLFFAAPIPEAVKAAVAAVIGRLKAVHADVKWVERENLHVTLSFLGARGEKERLSLEEALVKAALREPFDVELGALGAFELLERPKVLWIGLSRGADALASLAAALPEGADAGRPYHPHLTIGRTRSPRNLGRLIEAVRAEPPLAAGFRVERIVLYESRSGACGPVYAPLKEARLSSLGPGARS